MDNIIEVKNLGIRYSGGKKSIAHCSFSVRNGVIFGLLGSNGAGKSTIIKTLSGLVKEFDGEIWIFGKNVQQEEEIFSKIAYVPQHPCMFSDFTVKENLTFFCSMEGIDLFDIDKRVEQLLQTFFLKNFEGVSAGKLSGGYRQMLNIAISVILDKQIIIFDEPTAGLDIWAKKKVVEYIKSLKENGKTVIFTTHNLEEAEELCDHVLIISNGAVLTEGSLKKLVEDFGGDHLIKIELKKPISIKSLKLQNGKMMEFTGERIVVSASSNKIGSTTEEIMLKLSKLGAEIENVSIKEPSLNNVFSNALTKTVAK